VCSSDLSAEPVSIAIGQRMEYEGVALTVLSATRSGQYRPQWSAESRPPREGYTFLRFAIIVENTGLANLPYEGIKFVLVDKQGREYPGLRGPLPAPALVEGQAWLDSVVMEVPAGAAGFVLRYQPPLDGVEPIEVPLGF
jgi:hypothetical protein